MRVLVTGVAGFIGSHVAAQLQARDVDVYGCDDLSSGTIENIPPRTRWALERIQDVTSVDCDVVVHLAAVACARWPDEHALWRENLGAAAHALWLAQRADARFVLASTAAAADPESSAYAAAKRAAERIALAEHATVLRFANVYGPRQRDWGTEPGVLAAWQRAARERQALRLDGDGSQTRDFIHVDDVARATVAAVLSDAADGHVVDVCTGVQTPIREIAAMFDAPTYSAARPAGDPDRVQQDPEPARRFLGFAARVELAAGLEAA